MSRPSASQRTPRVPETAKPVCCAIYTRKSTEEGLEQAFNSLDAQREAAEAYIASQKHEGWTVVPERYDDGGFSGGTTDRPGLRRLLADVEAGRIDCVVVYKVDRLSRSLLDFTRIMAILDGRGVSFVSVTQQFNTTSSMGRLTLNILLSFAQFEREIIAERTRDKMHAARRKGKWIGGTPLLGYDVNPNGGRLLVNEAEAVRVREVFALYLQTESLLDTATERNRRGWTAKRWTTRRGETRGGGRFTKTLLHRLLTNATYIGQVDFQGAAYPGEQAAIVDGETWAKVRRLLRRNGRAGGAAVRNKHHALLRGLLWCTACDAVMTPVYSQKAGRRYRYYVCAAAHRHGWQSCPTKSLPAREIEQFVVDRIRRLGTDPALQQAVLAHAREHAQDQAARLATERRQVEQDLRSYGAEVNRAVRSGDTGRLVVLQGLTAETEARQAEIARQAATVAAEAGMEGDLVEALRQFDPVWENLTPAEQVRVVALLVERVAYDARTETVAVTFRPGGFRAMLAEVSA